jgi:hypothetical protein
LQFRELTDLKRRIIILKRLKVREHGGALREEIVLSAGVVEKVVGLHFSGFRSLLL